MTNDAVVRDVEVREIPVQKPEEALARVVDAVRQDSQEAPASFLEESTVPHGGE